MIVASITLIIGISGWFGIIIWAAWRRSWLLGGIGGLLFIIVFVLTAQAVDGPRPLPYGLLLGLSLFLGAGAVLIGLIEMVLKAWTRRRDGRRTAVRFPRAPTCHPPLDVLSAPPP